NCQKRLWSDGETRRSTPLRDKRRNYAETRDTFACRFYDRIVSNSPCENTLAHSLAIMVDDEDYAPIKGAQVELSGPSPSRGTTANDGVVHFAGLMPGHYVILTRKRGYSDGRAETDVPAKLRQDLVGEQPSPRAQLPVTVILGSLCTISG